MIKIIIIVPYFGKLRNDFAFWLKSVAYNSTIDFLIFTDNQLDDFFIPSNVKVIYTELFKIEEIIKSRIHKKCRLKTPYKLCDYRPAYGQIFQDYIKNYDFWGHCDTDMILGDLRHFLPDSIFNKFDRILANGHLTFYRNNHDVNNSFRKVQLPCWKEVYTSEKSFCYDEWGGTSKYWNDHENSKFYINDYLHDDIAPYVYHFFSINKKNQKIQMKNCMYNFHKGNLYRISTIESDFNMKETMYVHFQKRNLKIKVKPSDSFSIIPNSYIEYIEHPTKKYLKWHIRESIIWPLLVRLRNKLCNFIHCKTDSFNTHNLVLHS